MYIVLKLRISCVLMLVVMVYCLPFHSDLIFVDFGCISINIWLIIMLDNHRTILGNHIGHQVLVEIPQCHNKIQASVRGLLARHVC